ncbi:MAG: YdcF family protein [Alphaproteobacteria bacterium]|nr:YdcF family protein [Alphaproteobacteria bacterium]
MRLLKHIIVAFAALSAAALLFGFILFASIATHPPEDPSTRAEAIVALTGGTQRIRAAGDLLEKHRAGRLLISGVNRMVKQSDLQRMLDINSDLFACCVDIDYAAQNTRGNAIQTRKWASEHEFESLIVVTSSYHMPRSLAELGHMLPAVNLVAHPVVPDRFRDTPWWLDYKSVVLLGSEYLKFLPSAAQFGIGRLVGEPTPAKRPRTTDHRAVAIQ